MIKNSPLENTILQVVKDYEETWNAKLQEKTNRIMQLEKEVSELNSKVEELEFAAYEDFLSTQTDETNKSYEVIDEALKERLSTLNSAQQDTIIRETGVVLKDRIRAVGGDVNSDLHGVSLVDAVFTPQKGASFLVTTQASKTVSECYSGELLCLFAIQQCTS